MANQKQRASVPLQHVNEAEHRRLLADRVNAAVLKDGTDGGMRAPLLLFTCTVATLPDPAAWESGMIYVSDGAAGAKFRGSNGAAWLNLG